MIIIEAPFEPCKKCDLLFIDLYTKILYDNSLINCYQKTKIYNEISSLFFDIDPKLIIEYRPIRVASFYLIFNSGYCNHTILFLIESVFDKLCEIAKVLLCSPNTLFTKDIKKSTNHNAHYMLNNAKISIPFYLNLYSILKNSMDDIDISNNRVILYCNDQMRETTFFNDSEYLNEFTATLCCVIKPILDEFDEDIEKIDAYLRIRQESIGENQIYVIVN